MENIINPALFSSPLNWIFVWLVLYGAAISTKFIMEQLGKVNIRL